MALLSPGFRSNFLGHPVEDMLENCERLETERHVISAAFCSADWRDARFVVKSGCSVEYEEGEEEKRKIVVLK